MYLRQVGAVACYGLPTVLALAQGNAVWVLSGFALWSWCLAGWRMMGWRLMGLLRLDTWRVAGSSKIFRWQVCSSLQAGGKAVCDGLLLQAVRLLAGVVGLCFLVCLWQGWGAAVGCLLF